MSFRQRLLVFLGILLFAALLTALLAPFAVSRGMRTWLDWAARRQGVTVQCGKIDAPFLHEVTIDDLRIGPAEKNGRAVNLQARRVTIDLNFRGWLFARQARLVHAIDVDHLTGGIQQSGAPGKEKLDWRNLHRLLPDRFRFHDADLEVATAATSFVFRGVELSASEIESGNFLAHEVSVTAPFLRQTFAGLRGATSWENDRLTIAGISLVRGLDLEALTIDLSRLTKRQLGLEFSLDAFGGTLRASFEGRGGGPKFALDLTGSAANISLAQISSAAGLLEPLTGSVRASQFTFRGNPGQFLEATASIWIELSDFSWRARRGDHLVFGATYYNRRLQVEQLYVQQRPNELTVNGELLWPKQLAAWTALQFRGQINATIPDANAFAQLFGAPAGDVAGKLFASGEIDSLDPAPHGQLKFRGEGLRFRGVALDSLGGTLQLAGAEATLAALEIRHANDFLRAHGTANLTGAHAYSARLTGAINDLGEYAPLLPKAWRQGEIGGGVTFDWAGDGSFTAHSGTVQVFAHGLQLPVALLRAPLDVTLEGTYSPQDIFFRTFRLADERLSLGGFLMIGSNFLELQAIELALDGAPRATGTVFLPLGVDRWRKTGSLFEAFDERQKFDVDLAVDQLDLAAAAQALGEKLPLRGTLSGKIAAYGPLAALQLTSDWHLQNLGPASVPNALDLDLHYEDGRADANLSATFGASAPILARGSLPLGLEKKTLGDGTFVRQEEAFSASVECPALFPAMMPPSVRPLSASAGIISGQVAYSGTLRDPKIEGAAQLLGLRISPPAPWPAVTDFSADLRFASGAAEIENFQLEADGFPVRGSGSLTMAPPFFTLTLAPRGGSVAVATLPPSGSPISAVRILGEGIVGESPGLRKAVVRGKAGAPGFSLTITSDETQTTLFADPTFPATEGPLLLKVNEQPFSAQITAPR